MEITCILCGQPNIQNDSGYFSCATCKTIYSDQKEPANYDKYSEMYPGMKEWCKELKLKPNAWRKAANRGFPYEKVIEWFMNQDQKMSILDVGCGWGYMVYVLNTLGFSAKGIDISQEPIDFATQVFGNDYILETIENFKAKVDIITAIEVFEHLAKPVEWLKKCLEIAPKVILTTPNMGWPTYEDQNLKWISEDPPIHMACYRKESMEWLKNEIKAILELDDSGLNLIAIFTKNG